MKIKPKSVARCSANPPPQSRARFSKLAVLLGCLVPACMSAANAFAEDKSLKLFFGHTGERAVITFKRNGVYDQVGLNQLNHLLRDWRRNETIRMDPLLFDIVWEMYKESGATDYISVVSGYRSPNTNAMLRSRSSGVAKESQHTRGKAIDFFIPGVKLATLRGLGMQMQGGGVGYYPTSGSPFVHIDVGRVRAWPRMSRPELVRLFPDGRTLHIPSDGRPLQGYQLAVAEYNRRGSLFADDLTNSRGSNGGLLRGLFKRDSSEKEVVSADAASPGSALASVAKFNAPVPVTRPEQTVLMTSMLPTEAHPAHAALEALVDGKLDVVDPVAAQIPLPTFAVRDVEEEEEQDDILTASISPLPQGIEALSQVPSPADTGAGALIGIADHLPSATFKIGYRIKPTWTASFTPAQSFNKHRFGDDPCPPMTASKEATAEPC